MPRRIETEPPRIESLRIQNFRVLRDVELKPTPLTVLLGANGSGKSTVFDVFAFLSECFTVGLRKAWDKRGRFKEMRSRGAEGPIEIELKYREQENVPVITYHLTIAEQGSGPVIEQEWLQWRRGPHGKPFRFLDFASGRGQVISGDKPEETDNRVEERLDSADVLAVNTLGQFAKHPRVSALRKFIAGWYLSYLTADHTRGVPEAGPQEKLSQTGDNLPNVIQFLREQHPEILRRVLDVLTQRIPRLEKVDAELLADGRLLLQIKDAPFDRPILAKWASDGTLKMLAYLLVLNDPVPSPMIGIEEPENHLHPRLLPELAEECREASSRSQLMVSSHSPYFVNALYPKELWILHRAQDGYTKVKRADQIDGVVEFCEAGAKLGQLWMEGQFDASNLPGTPGHSLFGVR
jgi:predicted ATPase